MKVAIIGSRGFTDYKNLSIFIRKNIFPDKIDLIISGGAKGADTLAEKFAKEYNIETLIFKPDWTNFGLKAGMIRNKDIINHSDIVFAFWDGRSKGTKNSLELAKKFKKKIYLYQYNNELKI